MNDEDKKMIEQVKDRLEETMLIARPVVRQIIAITEKQENIINELRKEKEDLLSGRRVIWEEKGYVSKDKIIKRIDELRAYIEKQKKKDICYDMTYEYRRIICRIRELIKLLKG